MPAALSLLSPLPCVVCRDPQQAGVSMEDGIPRYTIGHEVRLQAERPGAMEITHRQAAQGQWPSGEAASD